MKLVIIIAIAFVLFFVPTFVMADIEIDKKNERLFYTWKPATLYSADIDEYDYSIIDSIEFNANMIGFDYDEINQKIYLFDQSSKNIQIIDSMSLQIIDEIEDDWEPDSGSEIRQRDILVNDKMNKLYLLLESYVNISYRPQDDQKYRVHVYDISSKEVIAKINLSSIASGLLHDESKDLVYAIGFHHGYWIIDNDESLEYVSLPSSYLNQWIFGVVLDETNNQMFLQMGDRQGNIKSILVVDASTGKEIQNITDPLILNAYPPIISQKQQLVFFRNVSNTNPGLVMMDIEQRKNQIFGVKNIPESDLQYLVLIDDINGKLYGQTNLGVGFNLVIFDLNSILASYQPISIKQESKIDSESQPEPICELGTELVNGMCQIVDSELVKKSQIAQECPNGVRLGNGVCIQIKYPSQANFQYDPSKGIEYYLDRYYFDLEYQDWFDKNFPKLTIEEAIGLVEPFSKIKSDVEKCSPNFLANCLENTGILDLNDVGIILTERNQFQDSLFYYDRALELEPNYAIAMTNKASALAQMGKIDEAIPLFNKAIQLHPNEEQIKLAKEYALSSLSNLKCGTGTILKDGQCVVDTTKAENKSSKGGGCLIATATYGSELAPQVQFLREIRDNSLLQTNSGTNFMNVFNEFYYSFSPIIADYERENPIFKEAVNLFITPMISTLSIMSLSNNSEASVLSLGISVILLNLGIYVVGPVFGISKIRSHIQRKQIG